MMLAGFSIVFFVIFNGVRLVAYVPQILKVASDQHGASAISCTTWTLFALSNLGTALYAVFRLGDDLIALAFAANTLGCCTILALTLEKRRRWQRQATLEARR